jgi:hypothetical protein
MDRAAVRELLLQLRDIIRAEREHAKALDMLAMTADIKRKEAIIQALNTVESLHPDDRQYAQEIQKENRQNAFLFRSTLHWIQDTMEFFGRKTVPITYSQYGRSQNNTLIRPHLTSCSTLPQLPPYRFPPVSFSLTLQFQNLPGWAKLNQQFCR